MRRVLFFFLLPFSLLGAEWQFSPLVGYRSNGIYRGALYWPEPSALVGIGIAYNNTIFLRGPMVEYLKELNFFTFRVGTELFNDNKPTIPLRKRSLDYHNERQETYGVYSAVRYGPNRTTYLEIAIHQDLDEHKGIYLTETINIPLIPFFSASVDFAQGNRKNNHYVYGDGAVGGFAHIDYSFKMRLPALPWEGTVMAIWKKSSIHKGANYSANYIRGDRTNEAFTAMLMWRF